MFDTPRRDEFPIGFERVSMLQRKGPHRSPRFGEDDEKQRQSDLSQPAPFLPREMGSRRREWNNIDATGERDAATFEISSSG